MAISADLNTYNAARTLRQSLEALRQFDEIVVCDMESTDSTLDIAREFGCKIVTFPKGDYPYCEPARNTAIQSATSEWVLVVDADEIIPAAFKLITQPAFRFFKQFVLKGCVFAGKLGYIEACQEAYYRLAMLVKIMERQRSCDEMKECTEPQSIRRG